MQFSITSRICLCLVCLLLSALLLADSLGIAPDADKAMMAGRRAFCESVAINCSLLAADGDIRKLHTALEAVVARNDDVLSAGLRRVEQGMVVEVGNHAALWDLHDHSRPTASQIFVPITAGGQTWGTVEFRFTDRGGGGWLAFLRSAKVRFCVFVAALCVLLFFFFLRRALAQLDPSKVVPQRVRAALDTVASGLLVLDSQDRIVLANKAFARTIGSRPDQLQGRRARDLPWINREETSATSLPWEIPHGEAARTGVPVAMRIGDQDEKNFRVNAAPIVNDKGEQQGVLASFDDVTTLEEQRNDLLQTLAKLRESRQQIEKQNRELQILATRDPLTGCLNRRSFFERFEREWQGSIRYGHPLSCIMVDIDHFKSINDEFGHSAGDLVLRKVAATLHQVARDTDVVCRYGGEEFCVLLPNIDVASAKLAGERLRAAIEAIDFEQRTITASFGISAISLGAKDMQELLDQADKCLYVAKRRGRNRVIPWDKSIEEVEVDESKVSRTEPPVLSDDAIAIPFHAVTALLSALAFRDSSTAAHSTRVADLSVAVARGRMSARESYILETAALLHDIGKIGVPDSILLKPGPLTDEEWKEMSRHDRIGVEIIRSSFDSPALSAIVENHHAFYGGRGRSTHLPTGTDIPLGARILSLCDAYDAMVSDRVYRKGRSPEEAFAELRRCAGLQFDPELVEEFIEVVKVRLATQPDETADISKETALQIGTQIEQLAKAVDRQDLAGMSSLAARLEAMAKRHNITPIAEVAAELRDAATDDAELRHLIKLAHDLLDLCRSTRRAYIADDKSRDKSQETRDKRQEKERTETRKALL
jgi:diguanylate cyclase (GGDEF)-like protein/PAS domain S-box-containing protein/putative nucleotidyltransferase with HDIG domain